MKTKRGKKPPSIITIEGVVARTEWNDKGSDAQLVILTDDEEEFFLETKDNAIQLNRYINARVNATGRLFRRQDWNALEVRRIRTAEHSAWSGDVFSEQDDFDEGDIWDDDVGFSSWAEHESLSSFARYIKGPTTF